LRTTRGICEGITNRRRQPWHRRLGIPVERFVAEVFDEVANGGVRFRRNSITVSREGRASRSRETQAVRKLVSGSRANATARALQNRSTKPAIGGVRQMSNCLDERPFTVDGLIQLRRRKPTSRSTVPTQRRSRICHASRNPAASMGAFSLDQGGAGRVRLN